MPREPGWWYRPPGVTAHLLQPLALAYGRIAARRIATAKAYRSRLPVICVGNFTAGGSGKTPLVAMLAERLIARGERPVILTRGFGGSTSGPHWVDPATDTATFVGDEPLLLVRSAPVLVARDRVAGARAIEQRSEATVIVMDDGLQNPSLVKDLRFAIVDGARMLGNWHVIPSGPLRLPMHDQAKLVDAIVYNGPVSGHFADELSRLCGVPALHASLQTSGIWLGGTRVVAFAGIGNPARFFETVRSLGATISAEMPYSDHARFTDADADRLLARALQHDARLVTTEKDHVRLAGSPKLDALAAATTAIPVQMKLDPASNDQLNRLLDRFRPR